MASELELRTCGRAGCRWPAAASLSFRYETRQVWLLDLTAEPHPTIYDLCPHHADALTVPRGWERVDQRVPQEALREPSGHDLEVRLEAAGRPLRVGGNRYAALCDELPRLAEEHGLRPETAAAAEPAGDAPSDGPADDAASTSAPATAAAPEPSKKQGAGPPSTPRSGQPFTRPAAAARDEPEAPTRRAPAVPARDLAPMPVEAPDVRSRPDDAADQPAPGDSGRRDGQFPGQLAIPVDDLDDAAPGDAIVVSIEEAGARRRGATS